MTERAADHLFAGDVRLRVHGSPAVLRHFDAEYGEATAPPADAHPDVDVRFRWGTRPASLPGWTVVSGGYKTARWRVALRSPDEAPLRAEFTIAGGPPSFVLSLVQGWFVEALVAVALARSGRVALPAAGFAHGGGVTVLMGRAGAGKTTLTARMLAAGQTVLSDDQVVLDAEGSVWRYPRRLRLYPDIERTAPAAWARLRPPTRAALLLRRQVRRLSRGYVAPSFAVPTTEVGPTVECGPLPVRSLLMVNRSVDDTLTVTQREPAWVVEQAGLVLADQRVRLSRDVGHPWQQALDATLTAETQTVAEAFAAIPATEVRVPRSWGAERSVDALQAQLGLIPRNAAPPEGEPRTPAR